MGSESKTTQLTLSQEIMKKYEEERSKRDQAGGLGQYFEPIHSESHSKLAANPWIADDAVEFGPDRSVKVENGIKVKVLIVGAGFGGLTFGSRFVEQGIASADDILFVDSAGGFGGTWYWNRYPGLMCDIESASYMPLLEETGYIPKHKYAYGPELRAYAELLARKYHLKNRGLFRATVHSATWNEDSHEWTTTISREIDTEQPATTTTVRSDMVVLAAGLLHRPKLPKIPGLSQFQNTVFHTARWDYQCTGGSPTSPNLHKLSSKKVGVIGTGATAIQVTPELAKFAKEVYVFQRTPVGVDKRGQQEMDSQQWHSTVATKKGWQLERMRNQADFSANADPKINLAQDGWTRLPTYCALVGSPRIVNYTQETLPEYVKYLHELDFPRQQRIRARTEQLVKNKSIAESLKPWYASWCKRPLFSDLYLDCYNRPNVHLVDTDGKGPEKFTTTGVVSGGREFEVDVLIFSTGFSTYAKGSPAHRADMIITGRDGYSMDQKWVDGIGTLHGLFTRNFPNLVLVGLTQTGVTSNFTYSADILAQHAAFIISEAKKRSNSSGKFTIEPSAEGEEEWAREIIKNAISAAPLVGCTPSYMTSEGEALLGDIEKAMRGSIWGRGMNDFVELIASWRKEGGLKGLEIKTC